MFFAALFHYLFLVASLSLINLVLLQLFLREDETLKKKLIAHIIAFALNWGELRYIIPIDQKRYDAHTNQRTNEDVIIPRSLHQCFFVLVAAFSLASFPGRLFSSRADGEKRVWYTLHGF